MSDRDAVSQRAAILIVEDDDVTATDLQNKLIEAGCVVRRAESAREALRMLTSMRADLIFVSLMLPDTDGLILCATLKAQVPAPSIVFGARSGEVERALALASGAIGFLTTPVDRGELLGHVQAALQRQAVESGACSPHHE